MSGNEQVLAKVESLKSRLIAIEAYWDGDSTGWYVLLSAITTDLQSHFLGGFSNGGDFKLFTGEVPPWPGAIAAKQLGDELTERLGVEFYFPSPEYPEDDCPRWIDRSKGYPCRDCGILLLQTPDCRWLGLCFHCHLAEERKRRELQSNKTEYRRYESVCPRCGGLTITISLEENKNHPATLLCKHCVMWEKIGDRLTEERKETIRNLAKSGYQILAIKQARDLLGLSVEEAADLVHELTK